MSTLDRDRRDGRSRGDVLSIDTILSSFEGWVRPNVFKLKEYGPEGKNHFNELPKLGSKCYFILGIRKDNIPILLDWEYEI